MWTLNNKINKQVRHKQTNRDSKQTDGCQIRRGLKGWVKKVVKVLRLTDWQLKKYSKDVKYNLGNIVNNIVIIIHSIRWVQDLTGSLCKLYKCLTTILDTRN